MTDPTAPGRVLGGRYRLGERLGRGGMSEVFAARDPVLGRDVAVKLVDALGPDQLERLEREARLLAGLSHPNVVTVHDAIRDGTSAAVVMELVRGGTLADRLATGPLPWEAAVDVAVAVARGLGAAHDQGVVHRDVKPSNVLLDEAGIVKVADFGIAGRFRGDTTVTLHGSVPYVAPEQLRGGATDARTDVYALGCLLHEMVVGAPPFADGTDAEVVGQHLHRQPEPLASLASVPAALDRVVARMLAKEPDDRYPGMAAVAADLEAIRAGDATVALAPSEGDSAPTRALPATRRRRRRGRLVVAGAVLAAVAAGLVAWRWTGADDPVIVAVADPSPTTSTGPSPSEPTPTPTPTTSPTPTAEATPATVEDAARELRALLADGRRDGSVSLEAEQELDKLVTEILDKHDEDKPKDVRDRAREFVKKLDERVEKGEVGPDRADLLRDAARRIEDLSRSSGS